MSSARPGSGNRYDGPWTWTAPTTRPSNPKMGAATELMPGTNSSRVQTYPSAAIAASRWRSAAGSVIVRVGRRLERPIEVAVQLGLGHVGQQHQPGRDHVGRDPLPRPVADLDLVVGGDLVEVHDVADVEDRQPGHLVQRIDELD